jgi:hypothetical protein
MPMGQKISLTFHSGIQVEYDWKGRILMGMRFIKIILAHLLFSIAR